MEHSNIQYTDQANQKKPILQPGNFGINNGISILGSTHLINLGTGYGIFYPIFLKKYIKQT